MRRADGLSIGLLTLCVLLAAVGCRNQNAPLTNPFLTPDRVPPPSTRVLTPGAAQPYYPGDPVPGSVPMGALPGTALPATSLPPAGGYAPSTVPPATAYPGAAPGVVNPVTPTGPVSPPGGWGVSGPRADVPATGRLSPGDSVLVPSDQQQARFTAAPAAPATVRTPIQNLVPPSQHELATAAAQPAFTPNAGATSAIQQAAYDETPPVSQPLAQRVQIREVQPAEYTAPAVASAAAPTRDGFRPQSNAPRPEAQTASPATGFRSPSLASGATAAADAKFGVGPNQEWLRGQLEYWPQTGEWSLKYMPDGSVDQIGGRILIDNPQVLGHLPPGEFVAVEGQVFGRQIDDASYRPAYRVAVVQRQRQ